MAHSIVFQSVNKTYHVSNQPVIALDDVSFSTQPGVGFLVITGASGSGKSTALQLIGGLEAPTSGHILIDNQDITAMSAKELIAFRKRHIGIIFQQFYLEPTLTLQQNIELPAMFANLSKSERATRTKEIAEFMGLSEHLSHLPTQLSGGQIQRAAIARAIYMQPRILLADEPTSNLDHKNVAVVLDLFSQIRQKYGTMIVLATHDQSIAAQADQLIHLENGRLIH